MVEEMEKQSRRKREERKGKGKDKMHRKGNRGKKNPHRDSENETTMLAAAHGGKPAVTYADSFKPTSSVIRNKVDPETAKYFAEISNLLESNQVELDQISAICGNALEETRGKELELATDPIISRIIQNLLNGCDLDQLCGFLRACAENFAIIATDMFGSHVAESAIKALAKHVDDDDESLVSYIGDTLNMVSKVVAKDSVTVMQSRYGSHVLRSLLCLCKGVPKDRINEFHVTKRSNVLATRLNAEPNKVETRNEFGNEFGNRFESVFRYLVREMADSMKHDVLKLRVDQFSGFVLQTVLRLSVGSNQELLFYFIKILLCGAEETFGEEDFIGSEMKEEIMGLLEDTASSHLLEVVIEVAPEKLYDELLTKIFMGSLFDISSHHWGNYVAQAIISSARNSNQIAQICEELRQKFKELIEIGKSGVVASLLAACQRLETNRRECCQALAEAVSKDADYNSNIIERVLYLDGYILQRSKWQWPSGEKMSILGCLMLQTILKYPKQYIRCFIESLVSMESEHILDTAKDPGGARVIEVFLSSDTGAKIKLKLVAKLKGHFGELAMNASSSFTVEECFSASNISLKEAICGELLHIRPDLSKTRHGFHLLKKLDIDGFARQPEQWRTKQKSKETTYREFHAVFGEPKDNTLQTKDSHKEHIEEENDYLSADRDTKKVVNHSEMPSVRKQKLNEKFSNRDYDDASNKLGKKHKLGESHFQKSTGKFISHGRNAPFVKESGKRDFAAVSELAQLASKSDLTAGEVRSLFSGSLKVDKGQFKNFKNFKGPFVGKRKR